MANKIGKLIKEAREAAGFTQAELSKKAKAVTSPEISKAERGELKLSDDQLKAIAKATGVTQKSLLEAAASSKYTKAKTAAKEDSGTKAATTSVKLTAAEKTIIDLYRKADADTKKKVKALLKGEEEEGLAGILSSLAGTGKQSRKDDQLSSLITSLTGEKEGKKKDDGGLLGNILQSAAKDLLK